MHRFRIALVSVAMLAGSGMATAGFGEAVATYMYEGNAFDTVTPPYTRVDRIHGSFSVEAELPPNLDFEDVTALVIGFSFSDGQQTITNASPTFAQKFRVSTDANGDIIAPWEIDLQTMQGGVLGTLLTSTEAGFLPRDRGFLDGASGTIDGDPGSWRAAKSYEYTGNPFDTVTLPYTLLDRIRGSFSVAEALAPNLSFVDITSLVLGYSFSDGVQTITSASPTFAQRFEVSTDADGDIIAPWEIDLRTMQGGVLGTLLTSTEAGFLPRDRGFFDGAAGTIDGDPGTWLTATSYEYTGNPFDTVTLPYTLLDRIRGSFSVAEALAPNLSFVDITALVVDYSFSDGVQTITSASPTFTQRFEVSTDANGDIIAPWEIDLRTTQGGVVGTLLTATRPGAVPRDRGFLDGASGTIDGDPGSWRTVPGQPTDGDGDGVADEADNCLVLANEDQRDTNQDGFGNLCDADLNNDEIVDFQDLGSLKVVFFTADPDGDLDGNAVVDFQDLGRMKALFFQPPGPSGLACAGMIPCPPDSPLEP